MLAALGTELARFKLPKRIFVADELPRNAMGKVQKNVLRERHKATFRQQADRDARWWSRAGRGAARLWPQGSYCWWTRKSVAGPRPQRARYPRI